MRTLGSVLALAIIVVIPGCQTPVPRGHFSLPEDSFLTVKRIEALVPAGMPIEEAREVMEVHGFVCTFDEAVGVPYLQCNQIKRQHLWPFNGTWMATIYFEQGVVRAVQARYDLNPVEIGTHIPKRTAREARQIDRANDARLMRNSPPMPGPMEMMPGPVMSGPGVSAPNPPSPPEGLSMPVQSSPPATVPVEIP
jgi:hypothetical protein